MFPPALRHAWRAVWQRPMLSSAAVLCLALGMGVNTTMYSIATGMLARPMPGIVEADRLVAIHRTQRGTCCQENSWPVYQDLLEEKSVFAGVEAHYPLLSVTLAGAGEPRTVWGQLVTPNFFRLLGVPPLLGKGLAEGPGGEAPEVVLSHSLWQERFHGDTAAVGRSVLLNATNFTIAGIAPPGFRGPDLAIAPDFWVTFDHIARVMPQHPSLEDRTAPWLFVYARLQPGVTPQKAQAALGLIAHRLQLEHRATDEQREFLAEPASAFHPAYRGAVVSAFSVALAGVGLVLLVACANVANLLLARASGRTREIAIRLALGATRARLVREMLTESLLLGAMGGAAGLVLAAALTRVLGGIKLPLAVPIDFRPALDGRVLAFTGALAVLTALLFGLVPALDASRPDLVAGLKSGPGPKHSRKGAARDWLVTSQVAVSVLLLAVSLLFVRSLQSASLLDPGFATTHLVIVSLDPRPYGSPAPFMARLSDRIGSLPGVESVTYSDVLPLAFGARASNLEADGERLRADTFSAGPGFLRTLGVRVVRGEPLPDRAGSERIAVLDEVAAGRLWPGRDPVGRRFVRDGVPHRVVGVIAPLRSRAVSQQQQPCLIVPFEQNESQPIPFGLSMLIRTTGDPAQAMPAIRAAIQDIEPRLAISSLRTMDQQLYNSLALPRTGAWVFGGFGALGILLTAAGVYGVVAYATALRTREFGIRAAIGAQRSDILRLVVGRGLKMGLAGSSLGLVAAMSISRTLGSMLYGVRTFDPLSFFAAPAIGVGVTLLACYLPARRASAVDPVQALRSE